MVERYISIHSETGEIYEILESASIDEIHSLIQNKT